MAKITTMQILTKIETDVAAVTGINKTFISNELDFDEMPAMRYPCAVIWAGSSTAHTENPEIEETVINIKIVCRRFKDNTGETTYSELEGLVNLVKTALKTKYAASGNYGIVYRYTSDMQAQFVKIIDANVIAKDIVFTSQHQEL